MGAFVAAVLAAFLASSVEAVEALTIVLAAGYARSFKVALQGAFSALIVLVLLAGLLGEAVTNFIPIRAVRIIVGGYLLIFGLGWLKKAILRAAGFKALHDEDEAFKEEFSRIKAQSEVVKGSKVTLLKDPAFNTAFKGVLLEGFEIILIVISLGSSTRKLLAVSLGALLAVLIVGLIGVVVKKQLTKVPENLIKAVVGVMLTSFGAFWAGQGVGVHWYLNDLFLLVLIGINITAFFFVSVILSRVKDVSKFVKSQ
jgi:uncharacterized membrane protein